MIIESASGTTVHTAFDLVAALAATGMTLVVYRWRLSHAAARIESAGLFYAVALIAGAVIGGFGAGTLNLWLSGLAGAGRSIVGALAGAIAGVELYKWKKGITGSTGLIFVAAFATSVAVGRWGCFLSGLGDETYGTPTALPWGHDFGDGVMRHPVQLYESFTMALFLVVALILIGRRDAWFLRCGFYAMVLVYAGQRFLWEFLKPYGTVLGPFNLFHFICGGLVIYSVIMIGRTQAEGAVHRP
ncbi:prolipoprotein diacylglyceryl transferase family protein [Taklimakanibacter deserti]|uniref:prolipoprotein diacylglyceryl transferase family protein n=1 Tax=Taklimakanibacter deserti TaxID=2267839 RepID=UPI0034D501F0